MTYEELISYSKECEAELNSIMPITQKLCYELFSAKRLYGLTSKNHHFSNSWRIKINKHMIIKEEIKNTIIHEILHTYPNCHGHKGEWKRRALIVKKYLGYNIKRCSNKELDASASKPKYVFYCSSCGHTYNYFKKPTWMRWIEFAKCGRCNGTIKLKD